MQSGCRAFDTRSLSLSPLLEARRKEDGPTRQREDALIRSFLASLRCTDGRPVSDLTHHRFSSDLISLHLVSPTPSLLCLQLVLLCLDSTPCCRASCTSSSSVHCLAASCISAGWLVRPLAFASTQRDVMVPSHDFPSRLHLSVPPANGR